MTTADPQKVVDNNDLILDRAIELAESRDWEAVTLHQIASSLNITLDDIRRCYQQKDDIVEAWFDRADSTVLNPAVSEDFAALPARKRVHKIMMDWLNAMHGHRRVTRQMLCYKLEFGHVHLQVLGVLRISRTVQWFREAAQLRTTNLVRVLEELAISSIFVTTFVFWLTDRSADNENTSRFLRNALSHVRSLD